MTIIEPTFPTGWEPEHRHRFEAKDPAGDHVVFSGSVVLSGLKGTDDDHFDSYEVRLVVGPWWKDVASVVPFVSLTMFSQDDWDDVDHGGWSVSDLDWDTIGGPDAPSSDEERIRLKFSVGVKGEGTSVHRIAYYVTARGRRLGSGGVKSPGPVH